MAEHVSCPQCGKATEISDRVQSLTVQCEHCHAKITVAGRDATVQFTPQGTLKPTFLDRGESATVDQSRAAQPAPAEDALAGHPQQLGRFQIRAKLGAGSFGTVYRAHDPLLEREVALKVPHPSSIQSDEGLERMLQEAKAAARLHHPHIVPVYDAGMEEAGCYIASAFIEGDTLQESINSCHSSNAGRFDFHRAAAIVMEVAGALAYADSLGIIHRDVKPDNIMLDAHDNPLLMDFGLARIRRDEHRLTHDGTVMGTPAYMSPEQAAGKQNVIGPASDQYGLGVVLYELLCGQIPFEGPLATVIAKVIDQQPPPPRSIDPRIPRDLETICLKAMAKDPRARFTDCEQMADDLRRWLDGEPIHARRMGPIERFSRWCRRNPGVAALSVVAVFLLALVAVVATVAYAQTSRALTKAEHERRRAEAAQERAEDAKQKESQQRKKTEDALEREAQERRRAETRLYFSRITLARQKWLANDVRQTEQLLDLCPADLQIWEQLHHWEWDYLKRLCHLDRLTFQADREVLRGIALSPDGKRIAAAGSEGVANVFDATTGEQVHVLDGDAGRVFSVAFAPDGQQIATGHQGGRIILWDAADGRRRQTIRPDPADVRGMNPVYDLAFGPDGARIASTAGGAVKIWSVTSGQELLTLLEHSRMVQSIAFSPDGKWIASAGQDKTVRLWNAETGQEDLPRIEREEEVNCVAFNPDSTRIAAAAGKLVSVFELGTAVTGVTREEISVFREHTDPVHTVVFAPDGRSIVSAGEDMTVRLFHAATGKEFRTLRGHVDPIVGLAVTPEETHLLSATQKGTVKVWDFTAGVEGERVFRGHEAPVLSVAVSPDGKWVASAGKDRTVRLIEAATGRPGLTLPKADDDVWAVAFGPQGKRIVSVAHTTLKVFDAASGDQLKVIPAHSQTVFSVAVSPDGRRIVTAGAEGQIVLWDASSGRKLHTLAGHAGDVWSVAFSPDGTRIASAGEDASVIVWEVPTGKRILTLAGHADLVTGAAFSADGRWIVSGSADKRVMLWDAAAVTGVTAGKHIRTFHGHPHAVSAVAFHPDGRRIASAGFGGTVKLWNTASGEEVLTLRGHTGPVTSLTFSPDGTRLISGGEDATVRIWEAPINAASTED